jgi:hypothetical protein
MRRRTARILVLDHHRARVHQEPRDVEGGRRVEDACLVESSLPECCFA